MKNTRSLNNRYKNILTYFKEKQPVAETELYYSNPYELLVAVILSAQCTDKRVNTITPAFFKKYPTIQKLSTATYNDVFELIRSCSYPNNKAKHLIGMATMIVNEFNGDIPSQVDKLMKLPGVGRKSANVIASIVFNTPVIAVDTHVFRVAQRLGLVVNAKTPYEVELQLEKNIPTQLRPLAHHWFILHGRYVCTARNPKCNNCGISKWCKFYNK